MRQVLWTQRNDVGTVLALTRGEILFVHGNVPRGTEGYADVRELDDGSVRLQATENILVVVALLTWNTLTCRGVFFIRSNRNAGGLRMGRVTPYDRLVAALRRLNVPPVHAADGVNGVLVYQDEILVPAATGHPEWFLRTCPYGWIVRRADIPRILATLPPRGVTRASGTNGTAAYS